MNFRTRVAAVAVFAALAGSAAADDGYMGGRTLPGRVTGSYVRAAAGVFVDTRIATGRRDQPLWVDVAAQTDSGARMDLLAEVPTGTSIQPGALVETRVAHTAKSKTAVLEEFNKVVEIAAPQSEPVFAQHLR